MHFDEFVEASCVHKRSDFVLSVDEELNAFVFESLFSPFLTEYFVSGVKPSTVIVFCVSFSASGVKRTLSSHSVHST